MQKLIIFVNLLLVCFDSGFAQNEHLRHDQIWLTGYASNPNDLSFGGTIIEFNVDSVETFYEYRQQDFHRANVSMCGIDGEILFSSDLSNIYDIHNEVMIGGTDLNPNSNTLQDRFRQSIISIPHPSIDSIYYLFHTKTWVTGNTTIPGFMNRLYQTTIDFRQNSTTGTHTGRVTSKNNSNYHFNEITILTVGCRAVFVV